MPEVEIIIKHEVVCPKFNIMVALTLCRSCPNYRYETVNRKVICSYIKPKLKEITLEDLEKELEEYD